MTNLLLLLTRVRLLGIDSMNRLQCPYNGTGDTTLHTSRLIDEVYNKQMIINMLLNEAAQWEIGYFSIEKSMVGDSGVAFTCECLLSYSC